ncbi:MAG: hypothetical protein ACHP93_03600 [Solirubrobacterales bacterium]
MTGLRLVDSPPPSPPPVISTDAPGVAPAGSRCRPGDRRQTVRLGGDPSVAAFIVAAADIGLGVEQAVAIAAEHHLVLADADALDLPQSQTRLLLCAAACHAQAKLPLSPAAAAYLRELGTRSISRALGRTPVTVAFPARLIERVPPSMLFTTLDPAAIPEALAWERAAVLAGRTMNEWAMFALLASVAH